MYERVMSHLEPGMILISCAAVSDYAVAKPAKQKIKKLQSAWSIELELNPDIVSDVAKTKQCAYVVGFAAETTDLLTHARNKLKAKKLNMVVANQVGETLGFLQDEHEVTVITTDKEVKLPKAHKTRLAGQIVAILAKNMHNAGV